MKEQLAAVVIQVLRKNCAIADCSMREAALSCVRKLEVEIFSDAKNLVKGIEHRSYSNAITDLLTQGRIDERLCS